jgi:hypothetical protein
MPVSFTGAEPPDQQRRFPRRLIMPRLLLRPPIIMPRREERRHTVRRIALLRREERRLPLRRIALLRLDPFISIYNIEMKRTRILAILLAVVAVFLTGLGGAMDFSKAGLTKTHAWNDGHFLMLFAIFMILL